MYFVVIIYFLPCKITDTECEEFKTPELVVCRPFKILFPSEGKKMAEISFTVPVCG